MAKAALATMAPSRSLKNKEVRLATANLVSLYRHGKRIGVIPRNRPKPEAARPGFARMAREAWSKVNRGGGAAVVQFKGRDGAYVDGIAFVPAERGAPFTLLAMGYASVPVILYVREKDGGK